MILLICSAGIKAEMFFYYLKVLKFTKVNFINLTFWKLFQHFNSTRKERYVLLKKYMHLLKCNNPLLFENKKHIQCKFIQIFKLNLKKFIPIFFFMLPCKGFTFEAAQNSILFGQSSALSGNAQYLGTNMRKGILSAFNEVNKTGGIYGRQLKLISLDDAYEPEKAIENTRQLIHKHKVFALIGGVGTPTSRAVIPIVSEESIPYIGPFTGAEFLRHKKNVINIRASYRQEIQYMVDQLTKNPNIQRISILYQDDSYGRAGLKGLEMALKKKNMSIASQGTYLRNTTAVKTALLEIMAQNPEAVVIVGAYLPTARFIELADSLNFKPIFICLSFVGTTALSSELKNSSTSVAVTQVVPFPLDSNHPLTARYQKAVQKDFNFVSLEGYLAGKLTIEVLRQIGKNPTRSKFLKAIRKTKKFSIDGFSLQYGLNDNQGSDKVFLTAVRNGKLFFLKNLTELALFKKEQTNTPLQHTTIPNGQKIPKTSNNK